MTNQSKDISANIGKTYDNLCQLIGENYTGNPEQVLKFRYNNSADLVIQPYQGVYAWWCAPKDFKNLTDCNFKIPCTLLEDLTPAPKNPNAIETVEELYKRVKEASDSKTPLLISYINGNDGEYFFRVVDYRGYVSTVEVLKCESAPLSAINFDYTKYPELVAKYGEFCIEKFEIQHPIKGKPRTILGCFNQRTNGKWVLTFIERYK